MNPIAPSGWYHFLYTSMVRLYYRRIRTIGREHLPSGGPVLYAMLHRNGAIDGMVYHVIFPRATFLISTQLTRSLFGRVFFTGIPVARDTDEGDRRANAASLTRCVEQLGAGGELAIFPEGTSDLGPRHLPFKPGIAVILSRALSAGVPVTVIPVGLFYQAPERFRSAANVVIGTPVDTFLDPSLGRAQRVDALMQRITEALEALGVNVGTAEELARIERLAAMAADGDANRYYRTLKSLERSPLPAPLEAAWQRLERAIDGGELATAFGAPVFSKRGVLWSLAWLMVQASLTGTAALANLPPLAVGWWAGRRFADARNTIALWRVLIGFPAFVLWLLAIGGIALALRPLVLTCYVLLSAAGLVLYPELIERWARLRNRFRAQAARPDYDSVRSWLETHA
ncbi:MAG: 1-acyl-sn-glycerol-3-phosphate acyltransferase [Thermoanaerobaculia bacterium]